jgi:ABC-type branched-subunit amino acid transport system permease subunit
MVHRLLSHDLPHSRRLAAALLLGYSGIVSFAHTMFFGIGAYGVAIASERMGPAWLSPSFELFETEVLGFRTVTYRTVSTVLAAVLTPDRWLLWLGVLFVLSVYHFPTGVVGRLRARAFRL